MNSPQDKSSIEHKQKRLVMFFTVGTALSLTILKLGAALITHSMAIFASAIDSMMDFFVSTINFFAITKADKPPDRGHPYGHRKVEHIASLFQCFFMSLSVIWIVVESIRRLMAGSFLRSYGLGIGIMLFSIVASIFLVAAIRWVAKRTKSIVLETEELHFSSDILTNLGVMIALVLAKVTDYVFWDLLLSLAIAVYLAIWIVKIAKKAIGVLMDQEPPREIQEDIKNFVLNFHPQITDIHDFRARMAGEHIFSEFHITIKEETNFIRAHNLTESLVGGLRKKFPNLEVNIHYDPEGVAEPHRKELLE